MIVDSTAIATSPSKMRLIVFAVNETCWSSRPTKTDASKSSGRPYIGLLRLHRRQGDVRLGTSAGLHCGRVNRLPTAVLHRLLQLPVAVRILLRGAHLANSPAFR